MKKFAILLLAISLLVLAGCKCEHKWEDATCLEPQTCSECKETQGEPLGHSWEDATCTAPKTCATCGETEGEALDHSWEDATCVLAKTCSVCGETEGEALGHTWEEASYSAPKTCSTCGEVEGDPLFREDLGMSTEDMVNNMNLVMQYMGYKMSYWGVDEDGWPTYDLEELSSGNYTNVYVSFEPNADGSKVLSVFVACEDVTDNTAVALMGMAAGTAIALVDSEFDTDKMNEAFQSDPMVYNNVYYYIFEDRGITAEMQVNTEYAVFWVYPVEAE